MWLHQPLAALHTQENALGAQAIHGGVPQQISRALLQLAGPRGGRAACAQRAHPAAAGVENKFAEAERASVAREAGQTPSGCTGANVGH
jgi:hypothetical protein